jgi:AsmA family/AsmA-like C-terminal region
MTSEPQPDIEPIAKPWLQRHIRLTIGLALLVLILLLIIVPPYISISRYKNHITQLVSTSLGRPARLSAVELRMLPRPGFVLTDLDVDEDPSFGAEPVLHASTVVASIRLLSLWRGQLALDRISVDEASVNLVRTADGRWNAGSLFNTAEPTTTSGTTTHHALPYMEATNSRINVKFGVEKIPFSLTSTDASLWREDDGWHIRLRGQPVRTDIPLDQADTGIVRLEATMRPASHLSGMPIHVDMDWRKAQLGQISQLILGSDEDWRGDLTGELHADGSADALTITTRLRATGVHRVEFEPATLLDFDANCSLMYHFSARSFEKIECNSPVGDGRVHLTGNLPSAPAAPQLTLELDKVPAQAPLDLLRTLRGNFDQSLSAQGSLSGKMTYVPAAASPARPPGAPSMARLHRAMDGKALPPSSLQGSFTGQGLRITGEGLANPIPVTSLVLSPSPAQPNQPPSLTASITVPADAPAPLAVTAQLTRQGFDVGVRGTASLSRLRDLAHITGITQADALSQVTSTAATPASLDLHLSGPWLAFTSFATASPSPDTATKKLSGSVVLRNAAWKPGYLAAPIDLGSANLRFVNGLAVWDSISFAYGPSDSRIHGIATFAMPLPCSSSQLCTPRFTVRFTALDLAILQAAILGAHVQGTLISSLIDRFRPATQSAWPAAQGTIQADSLIAGPFTFAGASARLEFATQGIKFTGLDARIFGGQIHGTGSLTIASAQSAYTLDASFTGINPHQAGQFVQADWSGGTINGSGTLTLSGFTPADLASSAHGTLNFDWRNGRIAQQPDQDSDSPLLTEFTRWTGTASIAQSKLTLGENKLQSNSKTTKAEGSLTFAQEPKLTLVTPRR